MANATPLVSVLMPTYNHAAWIRRASESLRAQTFTDWELLIIDDGSQDGTADLLRPYLADPRISYRRLAQNGGMGAALNLATAAARGRYLAYLPSDDVYYPDHLDRLVALLEARPEVGLAYGGLRWGYDQAGPTLHGAAAVGREADALAHPPDTSAAGGNLLALVQVLHRRLPAGLWRWPTRAELVTEAVEAGAWRAMLDHGLRFAYAGAVTCEWVDHRDQHHKLVGAGVSRYRSHYGLGRGQWLNWRPARGICLDERGRYGRFAAERKLPAPGGLRILLVGELGFNPERVVAFEERGHKLYGLWVPQPERWDTAGPLPYGNIEHIPYDRRWPERVRQLRPDVIYALLNWQAVALIAEVLDAELGIPIVFHFKEGPFICLEQGLWPDLVRVLRGSAGQIFINEESRDWFQLATDGALDPDATMVLDGDLPKADWLTGDWSPKLSALDGQIHTVCPGRPLGLDPFAAIADAGIHVHFYGQHFHREFPNWTREGLRTGHMHLHPAVEPSDWVRELSRYDAAWFHVFRSGNGGDLRRASWDDLNLPARLGTYAAAGLPWILKDSGDSRVAMQRLAQQHDVGVLFNDFDDLAARLRDRRRLAEQTSNMRAARHLFAFDTHVDCLVAFFCRAIDRCGRARAR